MHWISPRSVQSTGDLSKCRRGLSFYAFEERLVQTGLGRFGTTATLRSDPQRIAKITHGAYAMLNRFPDISVGNHFTDANVHSSPLVP
jgi:hypothetical protein